MRLPVQLVCVFGLMTVLVAGCEPAIPAGKGIGNQSPEIEGPDVEGKTVKLSDFRGKVTLVDFWATWCGPCKALIPHERELMSTYRGRPFTIIGVDCDQDIAALREFQASEKLPWPNIHDAEGQITSDWGVTAFPSFILIDSKGVIRGRWRGASDMPEITRQISDLVRIAEQR